MNKKIVLFAVIIVLGAVALVSLGGNIMSPYVSFQEARERKGSYVQIIGTLDKKIQVSYHGNELHFVLQDDKNDSIAVAHNGVKPMNFEHAQQVVILGSFNPDRNLFLADKLLVKCPSKYQKENRQ